MSYESYKERLLKELNSLDSERHYHIACETESDREFLVSQKQGVSTECYPDLRNCYPICRDYGAQAIAILARTLYSYIIAEESIPDNGDNFETVKECICCRLVNPKRYPDIQQLLNVPYLDLAVIFYLDYGISGNDFRSCCLLKNNCLDRWQVTAQEIFEIAKCNLRNRKHFHTYSMSEILTNMIGKFKAICPIPEDLQMFDSSYLITSPYEDYGVTVLLCPDILEEIAQKEHMDLSLILLNENQIVIEAFDRLPEKQLVIQQLYQDYNDILSDKVYIYHRESKQISIYLGTDSLVSTGRDTL